VLWEAGAVFVACSTRCFSRQSFEQALQTAAELRFSKFEAAIHEKGNQIKPSEVAADVHEAAERLRIGPGLVPVAFHVDIDAPDEAEYHRQFKAVCRLARISAVPVITLAPSEIEVPLETEIKRLTKLVRFGEADGICVCVPTMNGTHTQTPEQAVQLCEKVPGLGLTLDPSHYTTGPHAQASYDAVYPYVRHVALRDTGRGPNQFQVRVGQGEVEYGRIITQLGRVGYKHSLSVEMFDQPDSPFPIAPEVRKLKYLLESLL
jgi:sugar phosphate isomerase/epimerase